MKKTMTAVITLTMGLMLASCGTSVPEATAPSETPKASPSVPIAPTVPPAAAPSAAATTSGLAKSSRGNLIKDVGIGAGTTNAEGEVTSTFVVTAIEVDPICTGPQPIAPENGHMVVLTVEAETKPELANSSIPRFDLGGMGWKAIAENGTTQNQDTSTLSAFTCLDRADQFPVSMGPGEKAVGKIALDVVSPTGILIYTSSVNASWEWAYPAK